MAAVPDWIHRRRMTMGLAVFFVGWYVLQLSILQLFGENVARWWFYFEPPPDAVSPGMLLSPLSHKLDTLTHLGSNLLFLIVAGGVVEPYIGRDRILILVVGLGYLGTYLTNITAFIHQLWIVVGASGGVLALWAYAGLRMRRHAVGYIFQGFTWSPEGLESVLSVTFLIGIPVFFFHQVFWISQPHPGHIIGLLLGILYYAGEGAFGQLE